MLVQVTTPRLRLQTTEIVRIADEACTSISLSTDRMTCALVQVPYDQQRVIERRNGMFRRFLGGADMLP